MQTLLQCFFLFFVIAEARDREPPEGVDPQISVLVHEIEVLEREFFVASTNSERDGFFNTILPRTFSGWESLPILVSGKVAHFVGNELSLADARLVTLVDQIKQDPACEGISPHFPKLRAVYETAVHDPKLVPTVVDRFPEHSDATIENQMLQLLEQLKNMRSHDDVLKVFHFQIPTLLPVLENNADLIFMKRGKINSVDVVWNVLVNRLQSHNDFKKVFGYYPNLQSLLHPLHPFFNADMPSLVASRFPDEIVEMAVQILRELSKLRLGHSTTDEIIFNKLRQLDAIAGGTYFFGGKLSRADVQLVATERALRLPLERYRNLFSIWQRVSELHPDMDRYIAFTQENERVKILVDNLDILDNIIHNKPTMADKFTFETSLEALNQEVRNEVYFDGHKLSQADMKLYKINIQLLHTDIFIPLSSYPRLQAVVNHISKTEEKWLDFTRILEYQPLSWEPQLFK